MAEKDKEFQTQSESDSDSEETDDDEQFEWDFIAFEASLPCGYKILTEWNELEFYTFEIKSPIVEVLQNETSFIHYHEEEYTSGGLRTIWMRVGLTQEIAQLIRTTEPCWKTSYDQPDIVAVSSDNSVQFMVSENMRGPRANFNLFQSNFSGNQSVHNINTNCVRLVEEVLLNFLLRPCQSHHVDYQMWFEYGNPEHPLLATKIKYRVCFMFKCDCGVKRDMQEILTKLQFNEPCTIASEEIRKLFIDFDSGVAPKHYTIFRTGVSEPESSSTKKEQTAEPEPSTSKKEVSCADPNVKKKSSSSGFSFWDLVPVVGSLRSMREGYNDFQEGNRVSGVINLGLGAVFLASDVLLLGGIASFAKGAFVGATKTAATTAAKQGAVGASKRTLKRAAQRAAKKAAMKAATGAAEQVAKGAAEQVAKGAAQQAAKVAAEQAAKEAAKQAAKVAAEQAAKEAAKQAAKVAAEQAAKEAAKQAAKVAAEQAAKEAAKQAAKVAAEQAAKGAATQVAKGAAQQAVKEAATQAAKVAATQVAKGAAEQAAKEAAKQVAKGAAQQAVKEAATQATKVAATQVAKGAAEQAAKEAAKQAVKETAKQVAKGAAQQAAKETAMQAAKVAAEQAAKGAAQQAAKQAASQAAKVATTQAVKGAATQVAKGAAQQAAKQAASQAAKVATTQAVKGAATQVAKGAAQQTAKQAATQAAKVAAEQAAKGAVQQAAKEVATQVAKGVAKEGKEVLIEVGKRVGMTVIGHVPDIIDYVKNMNNATSNPTESQVPPTANYNESDRPTTQSTETSTNTSNNNHHHNPVQPTFSEENASSTVIKMNRDNEETLDSKMIPESQVPPAAKNNENDKPMTQSAETAINASNHHHNLVKPTFSEVNATSAVKEMNNANYNESDRPTTQNAETSTNNSNNNHHHNPVQTTFSEENASSTVIRMNRDNEETLDSTMIPESHVPPAAKNNENNRPTTQGAETATNASNHHHNLVKPSFSEVKEMNGNKEVTFNNKIIPESQVLPAAKNNENDRLTSQSTERAMNASNHHHNFVTPTFSEENATSAANEMNGNNEDTLDSYLIPRTGDNQNNVKRNTLQDTENSRANEKNPGHKSGDIYISGLKLNQSQSLKDQVSFWFRDYLRINVNLTQAKHAGLDENGKTKIIVTCDSAEDEAKIVNAKVFLINIKSPVFIWKDNGSSTPQESNNGHHEDHRLNFMISGADFNQSASLLVQIEQWLATVFDLNIQLANAQQVGTDDNGKMKILVTVYHLQDKQMILSKKPILKMVQSPIYLTDHWEPHEEGNKVIIRGGMFCNPLQSSAEQFLCHSLHVDVQVVSAHVIKEGTTDISVQLKTNAQKKEVLKKQVILKSLASPISITDDEPY